MATLIIKRSVVLNGSKTSVSLENKFWDGLQEIARSENLTASALVERIAGGRRESDNLSSEIRVFVLDYFQTRGRQKTNYKRTRFGNTGPECLPLTTQHVRVRTDIALILKYSSSGELGCKDFFAIIVSEHIGVLLSA